MAQDLGALDLQGVSRKDPTGALATYLRIQEQGTRASVGVVLSALKVCKNTKDLQAGKSIHRDVVDNGDIRKLSIGNTLVDMYARCGSMAEARDVFESMKNRDVVSWNCIIRAYAENGQGDMALRLYERMLEEGCCEDRITVLAVLKACSALAEDEQAGSNGVKVESLRKGKAIHWRAVKVRDKLELMVENTLIDMYMRCGSLADAGGLFGSMQAHDKVSWNCIISGYAQHGEARLAVRLYNQMQEEDCQPDRVTFLAALKACGGLKDKAECLETSRAVHADAGEEPEITVANTLITLYAKCGDLVESCRMFERMQQRSIVSWTAIILGHVEEGRNELALELYGRMQQEGSCEPDSVCYVAVLKACAGLAQRDRLGSLEAGKSLHFQVVKTGNEANIVVRSSLIDMYAKFGRMKDAGREFDNMQDRDVFSWTYMILGHAANADNLLALELYEEMRTSHGQLVPDRVTFLAVLKACVGLAETDMQKSLLQCKAVHSQCQELGLGTDLFLASSFVDAYSKCESLVDARNVFDGMKDRSPVSWNSMILGYTDSGDYKVALELYASMTLQQPEGSLLNSSTFAAALKACAGLGSLNVGKCILADAIRRDKLEPHTAVDFYSKCGSMHAAQQIFDSVGVNKDLATWSPLITGYSREGDAHRVVSLFEQLVEERVQPDGVVFLALLSACNHGGLVTEGMKYFQRMSSEFGVLPRSHHYSCIVDMLGRADRLDEAVKIMEENPSEQTNEVTLTALLDACHKRKHGDVDLHWLQRCKHLSQSSSSYLQVSNILIPV